MSLVQEKGLPLQKSDEDWMRHALGLARRGLGRVAPNPSVGCVLVKDGLVVGRGWTADGGRPHAETRALAQAGGAASGATAYVTLEPCAHTGETSPCSDALIQAGISRLVVAVADDDPRVSGKGIDACQRAGIAVTTGVLAQEARQMNIGFFRRINDGRPMFTSKIATTIDGCIALGNGESKWITGSKARYASHMMRARHDAIMVGVGTVMADDPMLDCRIEGLESCSPHRIVLDTALRTPIDCQLVRTATDLPTIIFTEQADKGRHAPFLDQGVRIIYKKNVRNIKALAKKIGEMGYTRVLIEGGAGVHASFIKDGCVDALEHFSSPNVIGGDGQAAIAPLGLQQLINQPRFKRTHVRRFGPDMLASFIKAE